MYCFALLVYSYICQVDLAGMYHYLTHYLLQMPIAVTSISTANHPVTVGVSDALYIDSHAFGKCIYFLYMQQGQCSPYKLPGLWTRYIYEYDSINVSSKYPLSTGSTLLLRPIPSTKLMHPRVVVDDVMY